MHVHQNCDISNANLVEAWYDNFLFVYYEYGIQPEDL